MPVGTTYRSGQAAKILGVSAHALRRLAEAGLVDADFTGSQWRFSVEEIQRLQREGLPPLPAIEQDGLRSARRPQGSNRLVTEGLLAAPSEELVADMGTTEEKGKAIGQVASTLANKIDADVILYAGPIAPPFDRNMIENCRKSGKRSNAYLIVVTYGGEPPCGLQDRAMPSEELCEGNSLRSEYLCECGHAACSCGSRSGNV